MSELVPLMMVVEGVTLTVVPSSTATRKSSPKASSACRKKKRG